MHYCLPRLWSDRAWVLGSQIGLLALSLPPSLLIARTLGPTSTGSYASVARVSALLLSAVSLSYAHALAQTAASKSRAATSASWTGALLLAVPQGLFSATALSVMFISFHPLPGKGSEFLVIGFALTLSFEFFILAGQHLLRGTGDFRSFSLNRLVQAVSWFLGILAAFIAGLLSLPVIGAVWLASDIIALLMVSRRVRRLGMFVTKPSILPGLKFGLRVHIGIVGRDIAPFVDQFTVVVILGVSGLGLYLPASTFSGLVLIVGIAMSLMIQPRVAAASGAERTRLALQLVGQTGWVAASVGAICALSANWLVPLVYGSAYTASGQLAAPLSIAVVFDSITLAAISALIGLGRPTLASIIQGGGTALLVLALALLLSGAGISRVPEAALLAYSLTASAALVALWRCVPGPERRVRHLLVPIGGCRSNDD